MAFSSPPEMQTMRELKSVLAPLGYDVSQKGRLLDCVEAAARNPVAMTPVGPALDDFLIPAMREVAGPFNDKHPWLRTGDWPYAFGAHFDFMVHDRLDGETRRTHCSRWSSTGDRPTLGRRTAHEVSEKPAVRRLGAPARAYQRRISPQTRAVVDDRLVGATVGIPPRRDARPPGRTRRRH